jgi:transcriptional regulator with XRE-family HTH domain
MAEFGEKLRAFRNGLPNKPDLDTFYAPLGVSGATGSRYESGITEPTLSFLQELSTVYKADAAHLMPGIPIGSKSQKPDGVALAEAKSLVERLVIEDRNVPDTVRWELISLVAGEIVDLQALGRAGEIEEKVRRWIAAAKAGLGE